MSEKEARQGPSNLSKTGRVNIFQSRRPWIGFTLCVLGSVLLGYCLWPMVEAGPVAVVVYVVVIGSSVAWSIGVGIFSRGAAKEAQYAEALYRQWVSDRSSVGNTFEVRTGWNTLIGWTFSLSVPIYFLSIGWLLDILLFASIIGLIFGVLGSYCLQQSGTIYADSDCLEFHLRGDSFSIPWSEVSLIETHPYDLAIAFLSDKSRIRIPGYVLWTGSEKHALRLFLEDTILGLNVPIEESKRIQWQNSKKLLKR